MDLTRFRWVVVAAGIGLGVDSVWGAESGVLGTPNQKYSYGIGLDLGVSWKRDGMEIDLDNLVKGIKDGLTPEASAKDKISYAMGLTLANRWKRQGFEVNADLLGRGVKDAVSGGATLLTDAELRDVLVNFQRDIRVKLEERLRAKNTREGETFLADNLKKPGVIALPSGLQYKVLKPGLGDTPKLTDTVVAHYRGTLLDGTEFDSSISRGEPATFPVNGVVKGWAEALQLMKTGAKWQLFVPPNLAYGDRGAPPAIGPGATLLFEVELLSIKPPVAIPGSAPTAAR